MFERLAELRLVVDGYLLEGLAIETGAGWTRRTTVVRLQGGGREGLGEDVNYSEAEQEALVDRGPVLDLAGSFTLEDFSRRLEEEELGPDDPEFAGQDLYRRWAFESAALDLALRQAGESLFSLLGAEPRPVRFVASLHLENAAGMERLQALLRAQPGLGLKLDATTAWTDELVGKLSATGCVEVVDFKGAYHGTSVDTEPDAALYRRVLDAFPDALIEDPHRTPEVLEILEPHRDRVTWDAPIHSVEDIEAAPWPPRIVNFKPSRFATLRRLLDAYDWCGQEKIGIYGGGQYELGPGRGQIQLLASLFHPDASNDVAPGEYNVAGDPATYRGTPLPAPAARPGFCWPAD